MLSTMFLIILFAAVGFLILIIYFAIKAKATGAITISANDGSILNVVPEAQSGKIKNDSVEGTWTLTDKNGGSAKGNFHKSKKNGIRKNVNPDRSYVITAFKDDIKQGYTAIYSNKDIKTVEGYFIDDKKEGEWKFYTDTGKIKFKPTYKNDIIISAISYNELGESSYATYESGIPNTKDIIYPGGENLYIHSLRESTSTYIMNREWEKSVYIKDIKKNSITIVCSKFENINERYYNIVVYGEGFDPTNPIFEKNVIFDGPNHITDNKVEFIIDDLHTGNHIAAVLILDKNKQILGISNQVPFSLLA